MPERSETKTARNMGVDALRIVSTMMVLVLHVLNIGPIISQMSADNPAYWLCMTLFVGAFCAVNCYGLISGYVGVYSRYRYSRLVLLWIQVVFYNLVGLGVLAIFQPPKILDLLRAISPLLHRSYWYFTAYCGMFFLIPVMNQGLRALTRRQARAVFWVMASLFSVLPTVISADLFLTQAGYSVIWLILLYIMGGCIRKGEIFSRVPSWALMGIYGLSVAVSLLVRWLLNGRPFALFRVVYHSYSLISYTSPTIFLCAVALLVVFSRVKCQGRWSGKIVAALAPASFGIYILHMQQNLQPLVFKLPLFDWIAQRNAVVAPLMVLLTALGLYLICAAIEKLRQWIFRALQIHKGLNNLESKLLGNLWETE